MKDIIESQQFDTKLIDEIFSIADRLEKKRETPLEGKIMASLFYEPSTRTRLSFESAMMRLGGVIVHRNDIKEYRSIMTQVGIQIDDDFFIVPTTREELEKRGVFNHSCEPNVGFSNSITFVAMRDIEPEEELVFDYAFCETAYDGFKCRCATNTCRHTITSEDWKLKDIQEKYSKYFSPYLKSKLHHDKG